MKNKKQQKQIYCCLMKASIIFAIATVPTWGKATINDKSNYDYLEIADATPTKRVKGTVVDINGEPIIGASVAIPGQKHGSVTNIDGVFELDVTVGQKIEISYIGFNNQMITIGADDNYKVTMTEDSTGLDEVIVVGYGSQKKSDLTGGIAYISSKEIDNLPALSLSQKLQGQVPGMTVSFTNARPGQDASILIRGKKTLQGSTSPLIVLDGVVFNGNLSEIDQNSVESITVLKDASSAAIYGARASNGVILITSKKGMAGKATVRYNGYVGMQNAQRLLKTMNASEYVQFLKDYRKDTNDSQWDDPTAYLQPALIDNYNSGTTFDWTKDLFRTALQTSHQLSVSGSNKDTNYYVAINYASQESIIKEDQGYTKYGITSKLTQNIGKFVKIGTNIQYSERDRSYGVISITQIYQMSPFASLKDENGAYIRYPMYGETLYYSPYADLDATNDNISKGFYLNGFAEVSFPWVKGLSYRANLGYSSRHNDAGVYYPTTTKTGEPVSGKADVSSSNWGSWLVENIVNYKIDFGKHSLNATAMYSAEKTNSDYIEIIANDFVSDANLYHNLALAKGQIQIYSGKSEMQSVGIMGRINYNYASKYLLTLTGRQDGSSGYSEGNKWGFFPSVAGAWIPTEEEFFKVPVINYLKLRLSYGANGNVYSYPYSSYTALSNQDYIFGSNLAGGLMSPLGRGNGSLKWEKTTTANLGIDFHLLQSKFSGTLDLYSSSTSNLLMTKTVPIMNGYTSTPANVGKVGNKGIEITLNSKNIETDKFRWNTGLTLSRNWDKIKELQRDSNGNKTDDISNKWFIGRPLSVYYDYKVIGIWQEYEREEAAAYNAIPGDAKLWDVDDDGKITPTDRIVIGSKTPKWIIGLKNEFTYQNFSLSLFLTGSFGAWHENSTIRFERLLFSKNPNYLKDIDYWTPENPSNEYTRLAYKNDTHRFYKKVNYIRIQDINFSYTFSKSVTKRLMIQDLSAYINISNLATFSNGNKYSTNVEASNYAYSLYPVQRSFFFGAKITF